MAADTNRVDPNERNHVSSSTTIVIAGAGLAGASAAETLRAEGHDGRIVLIGREPERPYERPGLSKDYMQGKADRDALFVHPADFYAAHDIDLRTGAEIVALDPGAHEVTLADGERLRFGRLLLATGASPRRLDVPGADLEGVHVLRDLADADAIRAAAARAGRVVVVGAGWIGCEVAASLRVLGREVTVVEPAPVPLAHVLGREMGQVFAGLHRDHGVDLRLGTGVAAVEGHRRAERVVTDDGRRIDADLVVVGVGAVPATALAAGAGLEVARGVRVDAHLRTGAPDVFAAGDVAEADHPLFGRPLQVEHWANARNQAAAAARSMLGSGDAYDRVPYFFTDQYDLGMEYSGYAGDADRLVVRGDPATREFIAFWLAGDRVVAGMNVNVWDVVDDIQRLIRAAGPVDASALADPDVPLERIGAAAAHPHAGGAPS